ncbi:MAG: DUF2442 domain-containing protein [Fimbriimonadaceae bacterium]|nr:DUF2442 domain-containing protein [Fimbriimonadaceae bacterium]
MSTSALATEVAKAMQVVVTADTLQVDLCDGRSIAVPLAWYPRLAAGTPAELAEWRLVGAGQGVHWPQLDADIEVSALLQGCRSAESPASLQRWLAARSAA